MSYQNDRYLLRLATPKDTAAIDRVLCSEGYPGKIAVQYLRSPDPYRSYGYDSDGLVMPVAVDKETQRIVAVGGCALRKVYLNGEEATVGYLTGMKIMAEHRQGRIPIREAYDMIRRETGERCTAYITTIVSGNTEAIRLLEKPRKGMPRYRHLGEYTVFCMGGARKQTLPDGFRFEQGGGGIAAFYRRHLPRFQFAPREHLLKNLPEEEFYTLRNGQGEILAAGALWDQQLYKQYMITRYTPFLRFVQQLPLYHLGYPALPLEKEFADYVSIALPVVQPDAMAYAGMFVRMLVRLTMDRHFVMLGLMEGHPLFDIVRRMPHVKYTSRVYAVEYGGDTFFDGRPAMLEVGLL